MSDYLSVALHYSALAAQGRLTEKEAARRLQQYSDGGLTYEGALQVIRDPLGRKNPISNSDPNGIYTGES